MVRDGKIICFSTVKSDFNLFQAYCLIGNPDGIYGNPSVSTL